MHSNFYNVISGLQARAFLRSFNFKPSNINAKISFELIEGISIFSQDARQKSFLTHSTELDDQIRFPLQDRVDRSFKSLAEDFLFQHPQSTNHKISLNSNDFVSIKFFQSLNFEIIFHSETSASVEIFNECELYLFNCLTDPGKNLNQIIKFIRSRIYSCDYKTALNVLNCISVHCSQRSDFHYLQGLCYNYFSQTDLSEICFEQMKNVGSLENKVNACYVLSMLYLRLHPKEKQDLSKAEAYLEEAYHILLHMPPTADSLFMKVFNRNGYALCVYRRGNVLEAAQILEAGLEILRSLKDTSHDLHQSVLLYNALQCYRSLENYSACKNVTEKLLELDPLFPEYHLEHGKTLLQQGLVDEARGYFLHAKKLDPLIPESAALIAYSYYAQQKYPQAIKHYKEAVRLRPQDQSFLEDLRYCEDQVSDEYQKVLS